MVVNACLRPASAAGGLAKQMPLPEQNADFGSNMLDPKDPLHYCELRIEIQRALAGIAGRSTQRWFWPTLKGIRWKAARILD